MIIAEDKWLLIAGLLYVSIYKIDGFISLARKVVAYSYGVWSLWHGLVS